MLHHFHNYFCYTSILFFIDVDSALLTSASVTLLFPTSEELLNVSYLPPQLSLDHTPSSLYLNASTGAPLSVFESALRTVSYYSTRQT